MPIIEVPKAPRGVGCGEAVSPSSPLGEWSGAGASTLGDGGCIPPTFMQGGAMPLIPLAATNLCQSSQCHIQLSLLVWTVILPV